VYLFIAYYILRDSVGVGLSPNIAIFSSYSSSSNFSPAFYLANHFFFSCCALLAKSRPGPKVECWGLLSGLARREEWAREIQPKLRRGEWKKILSDLFFGIQI